jgi:hypothetical protein
LKLSLCFFAQGWNPNPYIYQTSKEKSGAHVSDPERLVQIVQGVESVQMLRRTCCGEKSAFIRRRHGFSVTSPRPSAQKTPLHRGAPGPSIHSGQYSFLPSRLGVFAVKNRPSPDLRESAVDLSVTPCGRIRTPDLHA